MTECALLGSWDPRWVEDHRTWLEKHGPHLDGWRNRIGEQRIRALAAQQRTAGGFWFYAYSPKGKGGSGTVEHRFWCDEFAYQSVPVHFRHDHGTHHDWNEGQVRFTFRILRFERLTPGLELRCFRTIEGTLIEHGRALQGIQVVERS